MKIINITIFLLLQAFLANSQKPQIDVTNCTSFPTIGVSKISDDGNFVLYTVEQKDSGSRLYIKDLHSSYKRKVNGVPEFGKVDFIREGKGIVFLTVKDSLGIIDFMSGKESFIPDCRSYKLSGRGPSEFLAFLQKNKILTLINLVNEKRNDYTDISDYLFSPLGKYLLIKKEMIIDSIRQNIIQLINLSNGKINQIWQGIKASDFCFDVTGNKIAFIASEDRSSKSDNAIWYYDTRLNKAQIAVHATDSALISQFRLGPSFLEFNAVGTKLFFNLFSRPLKGTVDSNNAKLKIWSSNDELLPTEKEEVDKNSVNRQFLAVANLSQPNCKIIVLEHPTDDIRYGMKINKGGNGNYILKTVKFKQSGYSDEVMENLFLVNTTTGEEHFITKGLFGVIEFSPAGKYLIGYNYFDSAYFSYEIGTKTIRKISSGIKFPIYDEDYDVPGYPPPYSKQAAVWFKNDESLLIYDKYDIWKLDPLGKAPVVNLTNGYGRNHKLILRYVNKEGNVITNPPVDKTATLLLCAFNEATKENGFFKIDLKNLHDPSELVMDRKLFYFPTTYASLEPENWLVKAAHSNTYLLKIMSFKEYPNLCVTNDFKIFRNISRLAPQHRYNWLTAELVSWSSLDHKQSQGIIYKPENFDSTKKYPIIFSLYEKQSAGLYKYLSPELCYGAINIPLFVSQGYIVCCPDISYTTGMIGESAFNYVLPAVKLMSEKHWIDKTKMGVQGHSFGGYEVNYLITQTKVFAAAAEAAGPTDFVSAYGQLLGNIYDSHQHIEKGQDRFGSSLWCNQASYVNNSPVFFADKVCTPLLMMHNKGDNNVPWMQGVEYFTALRRLQKQAWLLEYENESHILSEDSNQLDYTIRLLQYFDHYLKNAPAPLWMSQSN